MTFLLVHGWGCDHRVWEPLMWHAGTELRPVLVDLRGHGRSPVARTPHTIPRMAGDLAEVASFLGVRDLVVVGHSMGGNVAVELAIRRPDLVRAVVSVDPAYGDPAWADAPERVAALMERGSAAASFDGPFDPAATPARVLIEALRSTYTDPDAFGHIEDTRRRLRELTVPLLSIYARQDAAQRARTFPVEHTVAVVEDSGHFIPLDQPARLWSLIREWSPIARRLP